MAVRNLSGRLVISRPWRWILPEVGLAMHPMRPRRVVFPEPLGPPEYRHGARCDFQIDLLQSGEFIRFALIENFTDSREFDQSIKAVADRPQVIRHEYDVRVLLSHDHLMIESGSTIAALHEGMIVATV